MILQPAICSLLITINSPLKLITISLIIVTKAYYIIIKNYGFHGSLLCV